MDDMFKSMFEKYLTPEDAEDERNERKEEFRSSAGIVGTTTPYDRLRRSLRRMFPHYPDVFDYSDQGRQAKDE